MCRVLSGAAASWPREKGAWSSESLAPPSLQSLSPLFMQVLLSLLCLMTPDTHLHTYTLIYTVLCSFPVTVVESCFIDFFFCQIPALLSGHKRETSQNRKRKIQQPFIGISISKIPKGHHMGLTLCVAVFVCLLWLWRESFVSLVIRMSDGDCGIWREYCKRTWYEPNWGLEMQYVNWPVE